MERIALLTHVKTLIRYLFRFRRIELVSSSRFGVEPWKDVQRLADAWQISVLNIFDVGANDGETTASLRSYFPNARIFCFEPQTDMITKLESRFAGDAKVTAERLALSDTEGWAQFFEYGHEDKIASMVQNAPFAVRFNKVAEATQVPCRTLDSYCASNGIEEIGLLKIDTEGHDHLVLKGAAQMILSGRIRFIYIEFNTLEPVAGQSGGALLEISKLLHPAGYRFVASYSDYIVLEEPMFSVSNALFAIQMPSRSSDGFPGNSFRTIQV